MLLTSRDGSQLEVHIVGYQFPDSDENWLLVHMRVITESGYGDSVEPCWETQEAQRIIAWFRALSQSVPVHPWGGHCLEHNLEFELIGESESSVMLRADIILEHGVWTPSDASQPIPDHGFSQELEIDRHLLGQASDELAIELVRYPPREPEQVILSPLRVVES